ncbi:MAG: O-acetyl-ADP-ribose deacetylase [Acidobacteriota bacterium]|nr:O-acetyl-ADP-ribose deacetylase [Acidobacteriota bacterium]
MKEAFLDGRVVVKIGDITKEKTDAIVNAANSTLLGGGGVDGAIHRVGGKEILAECRKIRETDYPNGLPTGEAVITTGGNLDAEFVIHTVGPIYGQEKGKEAELLANCYTNCLNLAKENKLKTVAFPSISTGAFYYPKNEAAKISSTSIKQFLTNNTTIEEVHLVFFSEADAEMFMKHHTF